ncbi:hypothetical protein HA402_006756 [Bradysia odoriphaga]|nr:hypothetical protein HA402_006756 [Bradysia odoriphaga]
MQTLTGAAVLPHGLDADAVGCCESGQRDPSPVVLYGDLDVVDDHPVDGLPDEVQPGAVRRSIELQRRDRRESGASPLRGAGEIEFDTDAAHGDGSGSRRRFVAGEVRCLHPSILSSGAVRHSCPDHEHEEEDAHDPEHDSDVPQDEPGDRKTRTRLVSLPDLRERDVSEDHREQGESEDAEHERSDRQPVRRAGDRLHPDLLRRLLIVRSGHGTSVGRTLPARAAPMSQTCRSPATRRDYLGVTAGFPTASEERAHAHALEAPVVLERLSSTADGLSVAEAAARLHAAGPNTLPEPPRKPAVLRFLAHFNDTLIYILLGAGAIKAIMGDWLDFWVIITVAVINAVIGYLQEGRAEKALAGIRGLLSSDASTRRDGEWVTVPSADLVPGDVVKLMPGDKVPADLRLIESFQLRVDEAALTGESEPSEKSLAPVGEDDGVGDRASMAFSGTIVTAGQAIGVVTATGSHTQIGMIQSLVSDSDELDTPLTKQLAAFGKVLTLVILGMAVLMMAIGRYVHRMPFDELISAAIGFAVAAIPEGLPALVTITLALGVQQMAKRQAITRKLPAVETLGSVTTICSDKTGTLTRGEMTVRTIATSRASYAVSGLGYDPNGDITPTSDVADAAGLAAVLEVAALCNEAHVVRSGNDWSLVGDPTEGAIHVVARKGGDLPMSPRVDVVPFDSENKFMATLNEREDGSRVILVKGAVDRLLDRATTQLGSAGSEPIDRAFWEGLTDELGGQGLRILAAARRRVDAATDQVAIDDLHDLEMLGLWGIVDPPRPEAIEAIADCHAAGIKVKMITGDHKGTAVAICREMGIVATSGDVDVLTGAELEAMSQEQLKLVVRDVDVYARTSPEHKIRIVRALQSHDEVVAMTGDAVNDAPALTRANVGVAMGIKGTEATKEAAEIVLADDNFATIRSAVREGRRIYDNLRKSIVFLLPTNGAQSLVILAAVLFGLAMPLTPVQVLWVNMITAITLSLALAYEPAEPGIMTRPPRSPGGSLINARELGFVLLVSLLIGGATLWVFYARLGAGAPIEYARTEAVLMLALGQLAYLFNCRFMSRSSLTLGVFRGNPALWWAALSLIALQLVFTYAPFMHDLFDSQGLNLTSRSAVADPGWPERRSVFRLLLRGPEDLAHVVAREEVRDPDHDEAEDDLLGHHPRGIEPGDRSHDEGDHGEDLREQPQPQVRPPPPQPCPPREVEQSRRHPEDHDRPHPDGERHARPADREDQRHHDRAHAEDQLEHQQPEDPGERAPGLRMPPIGLVDRIAGLSPAGDAIQPEEEGFEGHARSLCAKSRAALIRRMEMLDRDAHHRMPCDVLLMIARPPAASRASSAGARNTSGSPTAETPSPPISPPSALERPIRYPAIGAVRFVR